MYPPLSVGVSVRGVGVGVRVRVGVGMSLVVEVLTMLWSNGVILVAVAPMFSILFHF